jgi:serine/threonine protein kinase
MEISKWYEFAASNIEPRLALTQANVLVDKRGVACICDFGISRIVGRQGFTTRSQGTTPYKAPELLADPKRSTTTQSDIYSFALLVLEVFQLASSLQFIFIG